MKNILTALMVAFTLLVTSGGVSFAQDFQKGLEAAKKGDYATALREWNVLAELGDASAQFNLGVMYDNGLGVTQDYRKAVKWYRKSAEQGFASAQNNLGQMHRQGLGVVQDYRKAQKWYRKSAEQGNANAQYNLGQVYDEGLGVAQNYRKALKWFRKSAEQGNANAQYNLGIMYSSGQGITPNYRETAEYFMGVTPKKGQGVTQDDVYAHMWFSIAASAGHADAMENRDKLAKRMSAADISKAQELARECVKKQFKGC